MTCSAVLLYYTLFAMSRVSYLLVRDSFNLAFLVTFAFYFLVVKVTKSFGIKRNFFYWPYIIVNVPTMYLLRTTNNIPSTYGIQKKKITFVTVWFKKTQNLSETFEFAKKGSNLRTYYFRIKNVCKNMSKCYTERDKKWGQNAF